MDNEETRSPREVRRERKKQEKQFRKAKGTRSAHAAANVFGVLAVLMLIAAAVLTVLANRKEDDGGLDGAVTTEATEEAESTETAAVQIIHVDRYELGFDALLADSEDFDSHAFIVSITAALQDAYDAGLPWASIMFDDGTGIFYPDADINEAAYYGEMDEDGAITSRYGTITVNGSSVDYVARSDDDMLSDEAFALIGNEYSNDATYAEVSELTDGQIMITLTIETADDEMATAEILAERMQPLAPYAVSMTINGYSYIWTEQTGILDLSDTSALSELAEGVYEALFPDEADAGTEDFEVINGITSEELEQYLNLFGGE